MVYAPGGALKMLRELVEEMESRFQTLDVAKTQNNVPVGADFETIGLQPVFLIFDEFIAFIESLEKAEDNREIMSYMNRIILKGRQAGIQLVLATQRADAKYLPGAIRDNLGLRMSLGALEKAGYKMTFGEADREFEKFETGHGYIWIDGSTDSVREFYAPYLGGDYDVEKDLAELMRKQTVPPADARSASSGSVKGGGVCGSEGEARTNGDESQ